MKRPAFVLSSGADGFVEAMTRDQLRLDSSAPIPPGSRVEGTVGDAIAIRGKVISAGRGPEPGRFALTIALADLSRHDRERLQSLVGGGTP